MSNTIGSERVPMWYQTPRGGTRKKEGNVETFHSLEVVPDFPKRIDENKEKGKEKVQ